MAGVKDGFGVTIGVVLALIFIPILGVMLMCGGCLTVVGLGTGTEAARQAQEASRRVEEKRAAQAQSDQNGEVVAAAAAAPAAALPIVESSAPAVTDQAVADPAAERPAQAPAPDQKPSATTAAEQSDTRESEAASKLKLAKQLYEKS